MDEERNLFSGLEGEVTEEQWDKFVQLQKQAGNLIVHDEEEEDSFSSEEELEPGISKLAINATPAAVPATSGSDQELFKRNQELTTKYLNGELTFTQFTDLAEGESDSETNEDEMMKDAQVVEMELEKQIRGKPGKRRKLTELPRELKGLMGEANLCFARGEREEAIKMCMELIRSAPSAAEPFQTMAMIYEETGEIEKSLQFSLIAAHLCPDDSEEWVRLADLSQEVGDTKQAITCYTKALKCDHQNTTALWERCVLYEQVNEKNKALEGYNQLIKVLKPDQGLQCLQLAREVSKTYHEMGENNKALSVMNTVFEKHSSILTSEDINMLLELLILQSIYSDVVKVLKKYSDIKFLPETEVLESEQTIEDEVKNSTACIVPETLPIDLRIKLVVALIRLNGKHLVEGTIKPLFQEDHEEVGDLYLDVAEAHMEMGDYSKALPLLSILTKSRNYSLAAVWLRYAECLNSLGSIEKAVNAYQRVIELAPSHMEARLSVSSLLQQLGRTEEALQAVTEDSCTETQHNLQLLYHRCALLYSNGTKEEFCKVAKQMLSCCIPTKLSQTEIKIIISTMTYRKRMEALRDNQTDKCLDQWVPTVTSEDFNSDDLWDLYFKVCKTLFDCKKYDELQYFTMCSLVSPLMVKNSKRTKDAEFLCMLSFYFNRNASYAYSFIRDLILKNINNNRVWNLFSLFISMGQDIRHNKFCMRLMYKHPEHIALGIINGHAAMVAGSYKHALGEYISAFKTDPRNPKLALMIGITFLHLACQKFPGRRNSLVIQATAFFSYYMELRGRCQETYYNFGRAMHQLGLLYLAVHYYKKALDLPPAICDTPENRKIFDLSPEIAFNLSLIYQSSGNDKLAAYYIN